MSEVPDGTVEEVLEWVGDDPDKADKALEAEHEGQGRKTLIEKLEKQGRGHDPDKTTGRERAGEVHARNMARRNPEATVNEPDPEQLPAKPPPEEDLPEDGEDYGEPGEEEVPEDEYLHPDVADDDTSVDNQEQDEAEASKSPNDLPDEHAEEDESA